MFSMPAALYIGGNLHLNDAMQLAATPIAEPRLSSLGRVYRVHASRPALLLRDRILAALCAVGAIGTFTAALWRWYDAYQHFGPALVERWTSPLLLTSAGLAIFLILLLLELRMLRRTRVAICADGIILRKGRRQDSIRWEQIQGLRLRATRYIIPFVKRPLPLRMTLDIAGGKPVSLDSTLEGLPAITESIKEHVYPGLLEQYRRQLELHNPITLGPITITAQELGWGKRSINWDSVRDIRVDKGNVRLTYNKNGKTRTSRVPSHKIPNVDLCIQMVHHLGQVA